MVEFLRGTEKLRVEMDTGTRRDDQRPLGKLPLVAASLGSYLIGLTLGLAEPEDRLTRWRRSTVRGAEVWFRQVSREEEQRCRSNGIDLSQFCAHSVRFTIIVRCWAREVPPQPEASETDDNSQP